MNQVTHPNRSYIPSRQSMHSHFIPLIQNMSICFNSYNKQYRRFNYYLAEHCDNFYYINYIINLNESRVNLALGGPFIETDLCRQFGSQKVVTDKAGILLLLFYKLSLYVKSIYI